MVDVQLKVSTVKEDISTAKGETFIMDNEKLEGFCAIKERKSIDVLK
jgi:hypothetical protein